MLGCGCRKQAISALLLPAAQDARCLGRLKRSAVRETCLMPDAIIASRALAMRYAHYDDTRELSDCKVSCSAPVGCEVLLLPRAAGGCPSN